MKKKIAWITDSTAYIPEHLKNHPDLYTVPLSITFTNETYEDGVDLDSNTLYANLRAEKEIPKTSQPSIGKFAELFEQLKNEYEAAIAIHLSADLSGTLASCRAGAEIAEFPVEVVDSKAMSMAITRLLLLGMELAESNMDYQKIGNQLREEARKLDAYLVLGNLHQFYKGGRMSGTQFLLGNLLNIKPIIRIFNGKFELFEKVRSEKRAIKKIFSLFEEAQTKSNIEKVYIMHGNVPEKALEYKQQFLNYPNVKEVVMCEIAATIAVHAGEGTIAFAWANDQVQF
ncbi:MAG: DegV family protein [Bacillus sp. (in: firmicutes)]